MKGAKQGRNRLGPLVHLVCELVDGPAKPGRTRLCRILWLADAEAFRRAGRTLSGLEEHVMERHAPAPRGLDGALSRLEAEGAPGVEPEARFGAPKPRIRPLKAPEGSAFAPEELEIVQGAVEETLSPCSEAGSVRHKALWDAACAGEGIPVSAVLAAKAAALTPEDIQWAEERIRERRGGPVR